MALFLSIRLTFTPVNLASLKIQRAIWNEMERSAVDHSLIGLLFCSEGLSEEEAIEAVLDGARSQTEVVTGILLVALRLGEACTGRLGLSMLWDGSRQRDAPGGTLVLFKGDNIYRPSRFEHGLRLKLFQGVSWRHSGEKETRKSRESIPLILPTLCYP